MPKRHRQPEPIEITPSASGRRVASREFSHSCPEDDCPASPRENIEDYGDRLSDVDESYDSDEFHSSEIGDDGNGSSSTSDMSATVDGDTEDNKNEDGEDEDDDDDDDDDDAGLINVDFGVFEMKVRDVNAVMHLMDQLCPDRMNEVDRDDLGAALQESPFTSVVKIGNDNDNDNDNDNEEEEEEEIYGMASILDVAHGCDTHKKSLGALLQLLKGSIWRTINPGILPTDILSSVDDATGKAKCVLLIGEYIRNVPLELTSYILTDMAQRFETMFGPKSSPAAESAGSAVCASFPCFFALLSKIQRAVDVPVTTTPQQKADTQPLKKKRQHSPGHHQESEFDMRRYVFWREEDAVLYEYRDKRIATTAYRCRTQYDGQPENEIPLSILYVLPYGGLMQALAEVKKRESTQTNVMWY